MKKIRFVSLLLVALFLFSSLGHSEEKTATHTFNAPGEYTVTLTATDEHGAAGTNTFTINVRGNEAPVITIVADPISGLVPLKVTFTATVTDPDGDAIVDYKWDFGDNEVASVLSPTHTYSRAGNYTSTLSATDSKNNTAKKSVVVAVAGRGGCGRL